MSTFSHNLLLTLLKISIKPPHTAKIIGANMPVYIVAKSVINADADATDATDADATDD